MFKWFKDAVQRKIEMDDPNLRKCVACGKPIRKEDKKTKKSGMIFHRRCWKSWKRKTYIQ